MMTKVSICRTVLLNLRWGLAPYSLLTSGYRRSWTVTWGYLPRLTSDREKKSRKCCNNYIKLTSETSRIQVLSSSTCMFICIPVLLWSDVVFSPPPSPTVGWHRCARCATISPKPQWLDETHWPQVKPKEDRSIMKPTRALKLFRDMWPCPFYVSRNTAVLTWFLCLLLLLLLLHTAPSEAISWIPYCPVSGTRNSSIRWRKI